MPTNGSAEYSDLKVAWHLDRILSLRQTGHTVPVQVQLIISDLCNESCSFCAYRMTGYTSNANFGEKRDDGTINNNPARFIPTPKALEILHDAASMGVQGVQFTGGGEPTVHPEHMKVFREALASGLKVSLVSNGVLMRSGWQEVYPRFSWIRFSLDAGCAETYAAMREVKPAWFNQVIEHATQLAAEIKRQQSNCVFGISFVVTNENYREVEAAAELAKQTGAAYIRYAAIFSPELANYYAPGVRTLVAGEIEAARSKYDGDGFRIIDMFGQRVGDLIEGRPDYAFCGYQHLNVYIGGDLNVYRCCNTAYNNIGLTGSLKDQTFKEFWASEAKRESYSGFDARGCKHCAFHGKNRLLDYLVTKPPLHVEFP